MKVVIFAGGLGTRLSEETDVRPKPMVEIGGKPIIWHIMKIYSYYGLNDFIICCGYKGEQIKRYFYEYYQHNSDITFDLEKNTTAIHRTRSEPWRVTLIDTGRETMTGGRLLRVKSYLKNQETFCLTYGDGLSNVDIQDTLRFHHQHGKKATMVATVLPGRFGALNLNGSVVKSFKEKPESGGGFVNAGFFVLSTDVLSLIKDDTTVWEQEPLENLAINGGLRAYLHTGFWKPMDTLKDKLDLENYWAKGAPWKLWDE